MPGSAERQLGILSSPGDESATQRAATGESPLQDAMTGEGARGPSPLDFCVRRHNDGCRGFRMQPVTLLKNGLSEHGCKYLDPVFNVAFETPRNAKHTRNALCNGGASNSLTFCSAVFYRMHGLLRAIWHQACVLFP